MPPSTMAPMTLKRVQREITDLKKEDLGDIVLEPTDNLQIWTGSIPGPQGSVYEGGVFKLEIQLPNDYPFSAPRVSFKTKIYHMNISDQGGICIDILKSNWSPALSLFKVILSLSSLLTDPNPRDPLVPAIATQYTRNRKEHDATAREWTRLHAKRTLAVPKVTATTIPTTAPVPASSRSSGRTARATTTSNAAAGSSRSTATTHREPTDTLILVESDEEANAGRPPKRKRGAASAAPNVTGTTTAGSSSSSRNVTSIEVVEIAESDDELSAQAGSKAKKTRTQRAKPPSARTASGPGGAGSSGARRSARRVDTDVIVIDD